MDISNPEVLGTYVLEGRDLLMIGIKAETNSADITKSQEIEKADWFRLSEPLPLRPSSISARIVSEIFQSTRFARLGE